MNTDSLRADTTIPADIKQKLAALDRTPYHDSGALFAALNKTLPTNQYNTYLAERMSKVGIVVNGKVYHEAPESSSQFSYPAGDARQALLRKEGLDVYAVTQLANGNALTLARNFNKNKTELSLRRPDYTTVWSRDVKPQQLYGRSFELEGDVIYLFDEPGIELINVNSGKDIDASVNTIGIRVGLDTQQAR